MGRPTTGPTVNLHLPVAKMRKNARSGDIPSSDRILGTYPANFGTRKSVPAMPTMPSMIAPVGNCEA